MLDFFRRNTQSVFVKLLLGLVIGAFAVWGVGDFTSSRLADPTVAKIGQYKIYQSEVTKEIESQLRQIKIKDENLLKLFAKQFIPVAVDNLMTRYMLNDIVNDANLYVPDDVIRKEVFQNIPQLQTNGTFDPRLLDEFLRLNKISKDKFITEVREDYAIRHVLKLLSQQTQVPAFITEKFYQFKNETRKADFYELQAAKLKIEDPTDEVLKAHYDKNSKSYMLPEYRDLSFIDLSPRSEVIRARISEDDLKKYYSDNKSQFQEADQRKLTKFSVKNKEVANTVYDFLKSGGKAEEAKKKFEKSNVEIAKLDWVKKEELVGPIADKVFAKKSAGSLTKPFEMFGAWQIYYVEEAKLAKLGTFEEVKEKIVNLKAMEIVVELANQFEELLLDEYSLEDVAKELNLKVETVKNMPDYGFPSEIEDTLPVLVSTQEFQSSAGELSEGETSLLQETLDGYYFAVKVDKVTPAKPKDFAMIKAQVKEDWVIEKQFSEAKAIIESISDEITKGDKTVAEIVAKENLVKTSQGPFSRNADEVTDPSIPKTIFNDVFAAPKGKPVYQKSPQGFVMAIVTDVIAADPEKFKQNKQLVETPLISELDIDIRNRFGMEKKKLMGIEVYADRLQNIIK